MKKKAALALVLAAFMVMAYACSDTSEDTNTQTQDEDQTTQQEETTTQDTKTVELSYDDHVVNGLEEMTKAADVVLVGKFSASTGTAEEITKDPFTLAPFTFQVESTLKGSDVASEITVYLNNTVKVDGYDGKEVVYASYQEPMADTTYMVFLSYDAEGNYYYQAMNPMMIAFDTDGLAQLQVVTAGDSNVVTQQISDDDGNQVEVQQTLPSVQDDVTGKTLQELQTSVQGFAA